MKINITSLLLFLAAASLGATAYDCSGTRRPVLRKYAGYNSSGKGHLRGDVKVLQRALNAEGSYGLGVDGYFGRRTYTAVRNWQSRNGLDVDGIVGTETWGSLCDGDDSDDSSNQDGSLVFPIQGYQSPTKTLNFGERRGDGYRCHAGCDLAGGAARAVADGIVTNVFYFYACNDGPTHAVMVYHPSLGITINYGEVNSNAVYVSAGDRVTAGQELGYASRCKFSGTNQGMLHFEVYEGRQYANQAWYPPSGRTVGWGPNYCEENYLSTKPSSLMNCKDFLNENF